jgi:hypothetical protein
MATMLPWGRYLRLDAFPGNCQGARCTSAFLPFVCRINFSLNRQVYGFNASDMGAKGFWALATLAERKDFRKSW